MLRGTGTNSIGGGGSGTVGTFFGGTISPSGTFGGVGALGDAGLLGGGLGEHVLAKPEQERGGAISSKTQTRSLQPASVTIRFSHCEQCSFFTLDQYSSDPYFSTAADLKKSLCKKRRRER